MDAAQAEHAAGALDGAEQPGLVGRRYAQVGEVGLDCAQEREEDAQERGEASDPLLEPSETDAEIGQHGLGARRRRHRAGGTPNPAGDRGAGDAEPGRDARVPRRLDELDETVVRRHAGGASGASAIGSGEAEARPRRSVEISNRKFRRS
jgi:hypothetical protein